MSLREHINKAFRQILFVAALLFVGLAQPVSAQVTNWETVKVTASDGSADDNFGYGVDVDGDTAVIGAIDVAGHGMAYVFQRDAGGNWSEVAKLSASDGANGDQFGQFVAISGDLVIVSARGNDSGGSGAGAAYIFGRDEGGADNWGEVKKIVSGDPAASDDFGSAVDLEGNTAVVGSNGDSSNTGAVYVFYQDQGGTDNWGQVKKITANDAATNDSLGTSVSLAGDVLISGAYGDDTFKGSAYIFYRNQGGSNNWGQVKKLTATSPANSDYFGWSSHTDGTIAAVGVPLDDDNGSNSGSAYIFSKDQGGSDNWGLITKVLASDGVAGDEFGWDVEVNGSTLIVAADATDTGKAYVLEQNQGGANNWGETKSLLSSDAAADDLFGYAIAFDGESIVIGAPDNDDDGTNSGSAYIYDADSMRVPNDSLAAILIALKIL
jgi:FG-GAP repeat